MSLSRGDVRDVVLGYDPGGAGANGVALVAREGGRLTRVETSTVDSVDEVMAWYRDRVGDQEPVAAGIDSCLSWSTGPGGWRPMDERLRKAYPAVRASIMSSNSAFGAMTVQGMAAAMLLREAWPGISLNETHPKVLYFEMTGRKHAFATDGEGMGQWLCSQAGLPETLRVRNDHEWDALASAWATAQGLAGLWPEDLMTGVTGLVLPAGSVRYFWPARLP